MKFKTNTKPFSDALNLGIINANVSNFHQKSCVAQLTANKDTLKINLEASRICSELTLKGSGDEDKEITIFVGSLLLKQLVSTFDTAVVTLEFTDGGLILHSGTSKFTLPKMVDESELQLDSPALLDYTADEIVIDKDDWKFVEDYQMYAIAMSFIHPVYTRAWFGEDGDVIVGDYDHSLFTHSKKNKLGITCLLSDTIVNLFNSLPEGSKLVKSGNVFVIRYSSDSFTYVSQFTPQFETDEGIGSYNSDIFLDMMKHPTDSIQVSVPAITKFLSQAALLATKSDDTMNFKVDKDEIVIYDSNVNCKLDYEGSSELYEIVFKSEDLKSVISNYDDEMISISPIHQGNEVAGILVWNSSLTTVLAGVE